VSSIPTRFRQLRGETPFKSGVFAFPEPVYLLLKNIPLWPLSGTVWALEI